MNMYPTVESLTYFFGSILALLLCVFIGYHLPEKFMKWFSLVWCVVCICFYSGKL